MLRPITVAVAALITSAGLAYAEPAVPLTGVTYADLDLSTDAGAAKLVDRLHRAAFKACKYPVGTPVQRRCVAEAVVKAVVAINNPTVTKQYLARR